jgi:putative ABC transport system permease protein
VMPETFNDWRHLGMIDFFRPLAFTSEQASDRSGPLLRVLIRRSPARPFAEIEGFVADFGSRLAKEFPEANAESSWRAAPLASTITGKSSRPMFNMMIALSGLVLLIACSNLANLLLARTMARAREFAVRGALGASRIQLLRPLVAESLLLSLLGGVGGVFFAVWFRDYMALRSTGDNGESVVMDIGWPVLGWALIASLVTAVAFGMAPALFAMRLNLQSTLKSGGRGAIGGRGHRRFRQALIIGQFAVAMTLLAAAGVQIRGLNELNNRRAGWSSDNLITASILLPAANYTDAEEISAFHRLTLERLAALPGVASASIASFTPFFTWPDTRKFVVEGRDLPPRGREPAAVVNSVSPGYFDAYGTRLLAGRTFDERDTAGAPKVFIVSELTARTLFGRTNPIGQRLAQVEDGNPQWGEVVGVVADVEPAVTDLNLAPSQIYQPMAQEPRRQNEIAVRTNGVAPLSLLDTIRDTMAGLDPDLPVRQLQHAELTVERANYQVAVGRDIFSGMAALGLGLASLGIYGVIARTMAQRSGEFAIRVALGASLGNITRLVLASGVKLAVFGSLLGLLGGFGICRLLAIANPSMRMNSAAVLAGSTVLLIAAALIACWLPARRAGKVNPVDALRAE